MVLKLQETVGCSSFRRSENEVKKFPFHVQRMGTILAMDAAKRTLQILIFLCSSHRHIDHAGSFTWPWLQLLLSTGIDLKYVMCDPTDYIHFRILFTEHILELR
jgi:hypothetical protein